jgi:hypothetical protein
MILGIGCLVSRPQDDEVYANYGHGGLYSVQTSYAVCLLPQPKGLGPRDGSSAALQCLFGILKSRLRENEAWRG